MYGREAIIGVVDELDLGFAAWRRVGEDESGGRAGHVGLAPFTTSSSRVALELDGGRRSYGNRDLGPPAWHRSDFWEDYFDSVPEAVAAFEEAKETILAEERGRDHA
jgi:hypothetical protein